MLNLKSGLNVADLGKLGKELYFAAGVVEAVFGKYGLDAVMTGAVDKTGHNRNSIHARGLAIDIRASGVSKSTGDDITAELVRRLNRRGFDVVDERVAPSDPKRVWSGPHWHIEFDPKHGEIFWK